MNSALPAPWTGTNALKHATSVAVSGNYAYVTASYSNRLTVLDISDPPNLRRVGGNSAFLASHVATSEDRLFVAGWPSGLMILNLYRPLTGPALLFAPHSRPEQNTLRFSVEGLPGLRVLIEHSADLLYWQSWTNVTLGNGPVELSDPGAPTSAQRFYRAVAR